MRSEHRACDSPIDRNDAAALLLALTPTLSHALKAAMILDGQPYPYSKWLTRCAADTPTGANIVPIVQQVIDELGRGALRVGGPEKLHPLNLLLRQIRRELIDAARAAGIDEPWLDFWYLHLPKRNQIREVCWELE
jgi:hypothetical protein